MEKKEEIKIPWGTGIVGYVAESGEPVNIPDAYKVSQCQRTPLPMSISLQRGWL
jgi:signal transduction protein with GAF and PtsI domain